MNFQKIKNFKKILIYGYGVEGKSTEIFFKKHFPDITIDILDDNKSIPSTEKNISQPQWKNYDLIILSPGITRSKLPKSVQSKITSQIELFFENISEEKRQHTIGITGTKGKSTTTKFAFEVLQNAGKKVQYGGNYGLPFLDIFDDFISDKLEYIILELSSYQLESLQISPGIAIFLNLFPDHLDRHKTYERYHQAKKNIYLHQSKNNTLIIPDNHKDLAPSSPLQNLIFSKPIPEKIFPKNSLFQAQHLRENFGTIQALAKILNISETIVKKTAHKFKGLPHRLEFFTEKNHIRFYNDSISTTPQSTSAAIKTFREKLGSLIIGGKDRQINYTPLAQTIRKTTPEINVILLKSETTKSMTQALKKEHISNIFEAKNLSQAVQIAFKSTPPHTICLLSPAASSFDAFQNFQDRGNQFKKLVLDYK